MPIPASTTAETSGVKSVSDRTPREQSSALSEAPVTVSGNNAEKTINTSKAAVQSGSTWKQTEPTASTFPTVRTVPVGKTEDQLLKVTPGTTLNSIMINPRQKGNPIIKFIRNQPWQYGDCVPDYVLGRSTCALFLSLRYHSLHPDYIHGRMKDLGKSFDLRILLVQVDVQDPHHALKELAKICILSDCTLMLAWSAEEAGRYLETYKAYESKPPELLMERTDQNYQARITECLTTVKSVNKTNVITLLDAFKSFENISKSTVDDLSICPGFGPQKARRLHEVFRTPFLKPKRKPENEESPSTSEPKQKKTS
ncbi:DNA excision repair protein ERCC-1-like isoform X2 [Lineus longissimus]